MVVKVSQQPQLLLSAGDGDYHDRRRSDGNTSEGREFGRAGSGREERRDTALLGLSGLVRD